MRTNRPEPLRIGLALLLATLLQAGHTAMVDAAGPTFDLTTVSDKTYEFRFRAVGPGDPAVFVAFGSLHVDASGVIDSYTAWFSSHPPTVSGSGFPITPLQLGTGDQIILKDAAAGVYYLRLFFQGEAQGILEAMIKLTDIHGRNGIVIGRMPFIANGGAQGVVLLEGELQSP